MLIHPVTNLETQKYQNYNLNLMFIQKVVYLK